MKNKVKSSIMLSLKARKLLRKMADNAGLSMSSLIEQMIREKAEQQEVKNE